MAEEELGWRAAFDDLLRVSGVGALVAGTIGAAWYYWAYLWNVPLPIRALGVLAVVLGVLVLLYISMLVARRYRPRLGLDLLGQRTHKRQSQYDRDARQRLVVLFRAHGEPAFTEATNLLGSIAKHLEGSASDALGSVAALLMDAREARQTQVRMLQEALNDQSGAITSADLQSKFSEFYRAYQWCSRWIHFAGQHANYPFATLHPYKMWRRADAEFLRELKQTIANDDMEILREAVNEVGWGETIRESVTLPEDPGRSFRAEWNREAEAFEKLAHQDHYQLPPGQPMPGGISKVYADCLHGEWRISGGLNESIRKDVEVQCRSAGNLLRHTHRSRPAAISPDDVQAWLQFVADSGEVTTTYTVASAGWGKGDGGQTVETESPQIDVLTVVSARTCRRCAAMEPP